MACTIPDHTENRIIFCGQSKEIKEHFHLFYESLMISFGKISFPWLFCVWLISCSEKWGFFFTTHPLTVSTQMHTTHNHVSKLSTLRSSGIAFHRLGWKVLEFSLHLWHINTLRQKIVTSLKRIFRNAFSCMKVFIFWNNNTALIQIMAWYWTSNKTLSESTMV